MDTENTKYYTSFITGKVYTHPEINTTEYVACKKCTFRIIPNALSNGICSACEYYNHIEYRFICEGCNKMTERGDTPCHDCDYFPTRFDVCNGCKNLSSIGYLYDKNGMCKKCQNIGTNTKSAKH